MDFYKAISILGLNQNFTEEEFKSAYRKLSREYHPDKYEGMSEYEIMKKKQQEINAAKEFLRNYLRVAPKINIFNINDYITKKKTALAKIINTNGENVTDEDFITTINAIKKVITKFEANVFNSYVLTKEEVDEEYNICIKTIKSKFENFKTFFYRKNYINKEEVKEDINYECTLKEFYEQLQKIESKYGKKAKIKERLSSEIQKYQHFAGYEKLEKLINVSLKNALISIKQDGFQNIDKHIDKMNQEILVSFQTYHKLVQSIRELAQEVLTSKNELIQNEYEQLEKKFQEGASFYDVELKIQQLKEQIQKHNTQVKKTMDFRLNEEKINIIYQNLLDRYNKIIKTYNIVKDYEKINKLNNFLNRVLKMFYQGCQELKTMEFFSVFSQITFIDMYHDQEELNKLIQISEQNKSNIYIKRTNTYMFDDVSFFYFDEKNMTIYKDYYGEISSQPTTEEVLKTEYITLEEFLDTASFVGDYRKILGTFSVKYLYESDKIIIYYQGNNFMVRPKNKLHNIETIKPGDDATEVFRDKQNLCEMIGNQVKIHIEEQQKAQSPPPSSNEPNTNTYEETKRNR